MLLIIVVNIIHNIIIIVTTFVPVFFCCGLKNFWLNCRVCLGFESKELCAFSNWMLGCVSPLDDEGDNSGDQCLQNIEYSSPPAVGLALDVGE